MNAETKERWALNSGRARPAYEPKRIKCPGCGAGPSIKDESSRLVVCEYCGSHLDVGDDEAKVLGKGTVGEWDFPIELGESFRHKGQRFEVTARLALIEDGDLLELTRQYLLYNPRRGTLWLSEYKGHYDLTSTSHVMPIGEVPSMSRGDELKTHDGKEWIAGDIGEYHLKYVDGALPWLASVGDRIQYAEFHAKDGSGENYEVEYPGQEIEYSTGRRIPIEAVKRAMGKSVLPGPTAPLEDVSETRKHYHSLITICIVMLVVNGIFALFLMSKGKQVLRQNFNAQELTGETMSQSFAINKADSVIKIIVGTNLNNAWMALDFALVEGDDKVVHVEDADIEYYHGSEGGESWSEGSKKHTSYLRIPAAGTYHVLLHAVSGHGNNAQAEASQHDVSLRVINNAARPHFFVASAILTAICLIISIASYTNWKKEEDD